MIMTVSGNCRVIGTPSLVDVVAVPIEAASLRTTSTPSASRFRSGAAATPADSAGDRHIFASKAIDDSAGLGRVPWITASGCGRSSLCLIAMT
jgi:hypothetical protein